MSDLRTTLGVGLLTDELRAKLRALFGAVDPEIGAAVFARAKWISLESGSVLCRQGDPGHCMYIVISGRLQAVYRAPDGRERVVGEIGRAESVGEMALFSGEPRSATLWALRDSVLLEISRELFDWILVQHPQATTGIVRLLADRLQKSMHPQPAATKVTNVAVVPVHPDFPVGDFAARLAATLAAHGPTLHLSSARLDALLGLPGAAQSPPNTAQGPRLSAWLGEQEGTYRFVVYEADPNPSHWTRRAIRQADRILLVANAGADPAPGEIERVLSDAEERANGPRTLVLVHPADAPLPKGTTRWMAARQVRDHLHLRGLGDGEFARLGRRLAGTSVGLVLGGGGARGFAHIGVIRALREGGVPIDMIGGTSMGAFIAAQHAMGLDYERLLATNRWVWLEVQPQRQLTLPLISLVTNRRALYCAEQIYADTQVEDCWVDFFCVSSNLTTAEMVVHRTGPLGMVALASASLPVFTPPIAYGRHLLVDGGLVNNLPSDVMRNLGAGRVIACEVSLEEDDSFMCERVPSTWEELGKRLRRRRDVPRFPSMAEVLVRATMLGSIRREAESLAAVDVALRPPVEPFGLMEFPAIDRIVQAGYDYTKRQLEEGAIAWA